MTHTRYGRSLLNLNGQLTNTSRSDGAPEPDEDIKAVTRKKIIHYRQLSIDRSEPIAFMPVAVDTSGRIYDDFLRLLFLHAHREASGFSHSVTRSLALGQATMSVRATRRTGHVVSGTPTLRGWPAEPQR
jgi:hypothetical protein